MIQPIAVAAALPGLTQALGAQMQTFLMSLAAATSFLTFAVHTFIGGPRVVKPLLATTHLPIASKWLSYYCWHIATVFLLAMSMGFAYVALHPDRPELAVFLTAMCAALSALSVAVTLKAGINPFRFPSTTLFAITFALGAAALLT